MTRMKTSIRTVLLFVLMAGGLANADNTWVKTKEGSWEPDEIVLTAMKTGIEAYVKNEVKVQGYQLVDWDEYMFQYRTVELDGQKIIWINALCGKRDTRELESFTLTSGGGSCFFSLTYDPEKKRYYDFIVNGPM